MGPYNQGKAAAVAAAATTTAADLAIQEALVVSLLSLCMSSLRRGHANLLCIVPILSDDLHSRNSVVVAGVAMLCFCSPIRMRKLR